MSDVDMDNNEDPFITHTSSLFLFFLFSDSSSPSSAVCGLTQHPPLHLLCHPPPSLPIHSQEEEEKEEEEEEEEEETKHCQGRAQPSPVASCD